MAIFTLHSSPDENQPPAESKRRSFFKAVSSRTSLVLAPLRRSSVSNTIGNAKDYLDSPSHEAAFDFELLDVAYAIGAGFLSLDEDATQSNTNATERRVPSPELDEPTPLSRNSSDQGTPRRASVTKKLKRFDAMFSVTGHIPASSIPGLSIMMPAATTSFGNGSSSSDGSYSSDSEPSLDIDAASNFSFGMAADILMKLDTGFGPLPDPRLPAMEAIPTSGVVHMTSRGKVSSPPRTTSPEGNSPDRQVNESIKERGDPAGDDAASWRRFESTKNLLALNTQTSLMDLPSQAHSANPSASPSAAPSVTIPETLAKEDQKDVHLSLSLLGTSPSLHANPALNSPIDYLAFERRISRPPFAMPVPFPSQRTLPGQGSPNGKYLAPSGSLGTLDTQPLALEKPFMATSASFASSFDYLRPGAANGLRRESDVLKCPSSFLALESASDLLRACKGESGYGESDDILRALRDPAHCSQLTPIGGDGGGGEEQEREEQESSVEYPRSSYQALNSQSFQSVEIASDSESAELTRLGANDGEPGQAFQELEDRNGGREGESAELGNIRHGQPNATVSQPLSLYGLDFSGSETESLSQSFGSTSTVDYGTVLGQHPNGVGFAVMSRRGDGGEDEDGAWVGTTRRAGDGMLGPGRDHDHTGLHEIVHDHAADGTDADMTPRIGISSLTHGEEETEDDASHYGDEEGEGDTFSQGADSTVMAGMSQDPSQSESKAPANDDGDDTVVQEVEENTSFDMITLLRELQGPDPLQQQVKDNLQRRLRTSREREGHPDNATAGPSSSSGADEKITEHDIDNVPNSVMPVLEHLLSQKEGNNFSLGMGASLILNTRELMAGRELSECFTYPCRKSAFAELMDEVALYDPDKDEGEDGEETAGNVSQEGQLIAVSSLWTIPEESEPEGDS